MRQRGHPADYVLGELSWEWRDEFMGGGDAPERPKPGQQADQARKRAIDIERMRDDAAQRANDAYDKIEAAIEEHGPLPDDSWVNAPAGRRDPAFEAAREAYWSHPTVNAIKSVVGWGGWPNDAVRQGRDGYVERARLQAVPGFALLADDQWIEPGKMGWFGVSSETPDSELEYLRRANEIIDQAADDVLFTIVDCHI